MTSVFRILAAASLITLGAFAWSQESPSDRSPPGQNAADQNSAQSEGRAAELGDPSDQGPTSRTADGQQPAAMGRQDVIASLTIFVLAVFVGFEVITKVPPTLHTPLMSGSNAISGITLVGALIVADEMNFPSFVGFLAVTLATINVVGGFLVTHRMLAMFRKN